MTRYAVIGSGWRAEFYIRIAKLVPDQFALSAVMIRDAAKGEAFAEKFGVKVVNDLDALLADKPDFVVVTVKRGYMHDYVIELSRRAQQLCHVPIRGLNLPYFLHSIEG